MWNAPCRRTRKIIIRALIAVIVIAVIGGIIYGTFFSASGERWRKSLRSEYTGGLNRTVTVYSYDGTAIQSWSGKFDVTEDSNETYFDIDGKRVIIQGGIIINEEN